MPRPSRLGLALAATVAASSLFVGGGIAAAAPTDECSDATTALAAATDANRAQLQAAKDTACAATGNGGQQSGQTGNSGEQSGQTGNSGQQSGQTGNSGQQTGQTGQQSGQTGNSGQQTGQTGQTGQQSGQTGNSGQQSGQTGQTGQTGNGGGYQKPGSYKPWKGDKGDARKDRNDPPRRQGDEKDCRDFDNRDEAQRWYKDNGRPGDKDPSRLDRDKDGRACENDDDDGDDSDPVIPPKVDVTVIINQTEDDGSEATTSGEQVKQVPEGSVDTGSAQ